MWNKTPDYPDMKLTFTIMLYKLFSIFGKNYLVDVAPNKISDYPQITRKYKTFNGNKSQQIPAKIIL